MMAPEKLDESKYVYVCRWYDNGLQIAGNTLSVWHVSAINLELYAVR